MSIKAHTLFHDDGGDALFLDDPKGLFDLVHDHRGEALIGLVKEQQLDVARKRARWQASAVRPPTG